MNLTSTLSADRLLHSIEAARILGVSPAWLARHRWAGTGPVYVRVGGASGRAVRYLRADLDAWVARNRIEAIQGSRHAR